MLRCFLSLLLVAAVSVSLAGCGDTYVNIPAEAGDVASHNPNDSNARQVMVAALQAVIANMPGKEKIGIATPPGTSALTQAAVVNQLGPRAVMAGDDVKAPVELDVQAVRIRGTVASVDIQRPSATSPGGKELVTVDLTWAPFSNWSVQNQQVWRNVN